MSSRDVAAGTGDGRPCGGASLVMDVLRAFSRGALMVCVGVALAVLVRTFVIERFVVPTPSMAPTIGVDEQIVCEKVSYAFSDVDVGDIVCFESDYHGGAVLVKRVIARGGQTVDIHDGRVFVDGEASGYGHGMTDQLGTVVTYPITLGADELWVMGDNREESADSRVFGPVHRSDVIGRVVGRVWPPSGIK